MKNLSIDIETYSSANLSKCGVYRYSEAADFTILLFGYSVDGEPVKVVDLANGEKLPKDILEALTDSTVNKWAFNAMFERICISRWLGMPTGEYLNPDSWYCTMVWSATLGLPLSLEGAGAVLGLEKQKMQEGKELIKLFCTPKALKDGTVKRVLSDDYPDKWELFKQYNARDVETELCIKSKLQRFQVSEDEWNNYHLDQRINDTGIMIDQPFVKQAIKCDEQFKQAHMEMAQKVTGLDNPNSAAQMKTWLSEQGVETESLNKAIVVELLDSAEGDVKLALSLRKDLAKSSVSKYRAMEQCICSDSRARGLIQFYGTHTGRYAGRLVQVQNLPQNHIKDLELARKIVRDGEFETVELLYDSVPVVLSELIRTAFVPKEGYRFYVADFSAVEARCLAFLAGEQWRNQLFKDGGDIYCQSASQMFKVPVIKNGINGHLRQKGKVAELACIAEHSLVLTDKGLVPIEAVTTEMKLWDGENWIEHDGVIFKGEREVITYDGLTATPDHLVWIKGKKEPIQFGVAASGRAHLIKTGDGRNTIWLGHNHFSRETVEQKLESLLCTYKVPRLWEHPMAIIRCASIWEIKRMSALFTAKTNSKMVKQPTDSCKAKMRKSKGKRLSQLWRQRDTLRFSKCDCSGYLSDKSLWNTAKSNGNRSNRYKRKLRTGKFEVCETLSKLYQSAKKCSFGILSRILAIFTNRCRQETITRTQQRGNNPRCGACCKREKEKLEVNKRKVGVYDIQNAGPNHRFTVSNCLVHNCGYGGSVGALTAMGALSMGLQESELKPLVDAWREANPSIVQFWWDVDEAIKHCVRDKARTSVNNIEFSYESGLMFIRLPSSRRLAYVKPRMGVNRFGGESITYEGTGSQKKWQRIESYGPKFVENIVQAYARDLLAEAIKRLTEHDFRIVMHVHDEVVVEAPENTSLEEICSIMGETPSWAEGLLLRADGYSCDFYKKD